VREFWKKIAGALKLTALKPVETPKNSSPAGELAAAAVAIRSSVVAGATDKRGDEAAKIYPLRKRGYHRAVKRKEPWAVRVRRMEETDPIAAIMWWCYEWPDGGRAFRRMLYADNPWLMMIPKKDDRFEVRSYPIPAPFIGRR
jgi:hypothetical protein